MVMGPESVEPAVRPDAVEVFQPALVKGVALDIVEDVSRLRGGEQIEALAGLRLAQLEARGAGLAGLLQAGLGYQAGARGLGQAAYRVVVPGKSLHGPDAGGFALLHLRTGDVGDVAQAVLGLPDALAMIPPAAPRAVGSGEGSRRRRVLNEVLEPAARVPSIVLIVCQPQAHSASIAQLSLLVPRVRPLTP